MHKFILRIVLVLALALSGCATTAPVKPYVKSNAIRQGKMAILPFENHSNDAGAGKVVDNLLYMAFIQYPSMKIAKPDQVQETLKELKAGPSLKSQHVKELRRLLGVDYVMVGKVIDFAAGDFPLVSFSVRVLDAETGTLVWALNISRKGKDAGNLFGAGKVRSVQMLAGMVIEEIARSFNSSIVKENGKVPGAYAVIAAASAVSEQGNGKVEGTSAEPPATEAASPKGATPEGAPVPAPEKKETVEALPTVSPKPAQPATAPVITRAAQADDARGEAAVPPQRSPDLPSSASGEERAPVGAETTLPPAKEVKEGYPLPVTGNTPIPAPLPVKASYPVTVSETTVAQDACPEGPVEEGNGTAASPLDLTIHFGTNKSGINSGYYMQAGRIAAFLKENPKAVLSIEGHADYLGSPRYNLALSQRRADRVKGYLEKSFSIASSRITTKGAGCTKPVADNAIPGGREKNRRAVVRIFASDRKSGRYKVMGKR